VQAGAAVSDWRFASTLLDPRGGLPDSDVDLVVLVREGDLTAWQRVQELAASLSLAYDLVLSVNLLSQKEWEELQRLGTLYARRL